jgi:probable biosynthetic protein (TIGR04098 family)
MSTLSMIWRKQQTRWYGRLVERSHQLRRHLAYYVARHGFEIGDYSIGAPTVLFWNDASRLKIGKYCSVAAGVTFVLGGQHRSDTVTTFPLGMPFGNWEPGQGPYSRGDITIGSDVWIGANATILSGVTIADGAVVGAGSVVIHDVPPYTVVFGNPARAIAKRFSDDAVQALMELRWWDLEAAQVRSLQPLLQNNDVDLLIAELRRRKGLPRGEKGADKVERKAASSIRTEMSSGASSEQVAALIRSELPTFSASDLDTPLRRLGIDSFAMLTLRVRLEQAVGTTIDDQSWTSIVTPADIVRIVARIVPRLDHSPASAPSTQRRVYQVNMPQMALGGLSELWLFKELGDIHWSLITHGLQTPSSRLKDAGGHRLYATFTRFQLSSNAGLAAYAENETLTIDAEMSRYGAGIFFSDATIRGDGRSARARIMSSFSKYGEAGANTSLLKGQPEIPADCEIPALAEFPEFGQEYRTRRAQPLAPAIFECRYEIIPTHDINGVGLLYFAAYPIINDICAMRHAGRGLATDFSTQRRDVFYFANCDPDETLTYRIHRWSAEGDRIEMEESISRTSDGVLMAYAMTDKERVDAEANGGGDHGFLG